MDDERKKLLEHNFEMIERNKSLLEKISEKHEHLRERALGHVYQLITAIGIVAGFGFTAVSSVESINRFFLGETLLFSAMAVGMWFARAGFIDEVKFLDKWFKEVKGVFDDRTEVDITDSAIEMRQKMDAAITKETSFFKEDIKLPDFYWLKIIFSLFIAGGGLLLSSFINLCRLIPWMI